MLCLQETKMEGMTNGILMSYRFFRSDAVAARGTAGGILIL